MLLAAVVLVIAALVLGGLYLRALPEAPACPGCAAVTRVAAGDRLAPFLHEARVSAVRECTRCGWRGRRRWKWAPRRVSRGH